MVSEQPQEETRTFSLKVLVDKQRNKVVVVEATKDFVDTLFSFLSLPLGTIIRLISNNDQQQQSSVSESSSFLGNINNLYQSVQNLNSNDVWNNPVCQQMLLHPRNPCEALCMKLFLNVDDTEPSNKIFVCDNCNTYTTFQNLACTCGKPTNKQPQNLDSEGKGNNSTRVDAQNDVFVKENGPDFTVSLFDDLKIVRSSIIDALPLLNELGYTDLTQLEVITHKFGKQEISNLLKYCLTSHEPLTNTILKHSSENKDNLPNQTSSAHRAMPCSNDKSKMDVKVVHSKSQKKIIFAEANGYFVNFILSFLTMPLGSIINLLGPNSFVGCAANLYKSVENLDSSLCTSSRTTLLNPGVAPQFGCSNQLLNIPHAEHPLYYYGTGIPKRVYDSSFQSYKIIEEKIDGGVISKTQGSILKGRTLNVLDPRSPNRSKEGIVGFVKKETLYSVGDDLMVKALSFDSWLSYFKESSISLDDLEVKVVSIGEIEAMKILGASLTSKFTLTTGLGDFLKGSTFISN